MSCGYQGSHFGAHYEDACCIDGYLWDLDSGDENGLDCGGDTPCPQCRTRDYYRNFQDDIEMSGYESVDHPLTTYKQFPKFKQVPASERRLLKRFWMRGRKARISEELQLN